MQLRLEVRGVFFFFFCILHEFKIEFVPTSCNVGALNICKVLSDLLPVCLCNGIVDVDYLSSGFPDGERAERLSGLPEI